MSEKEFYLVDLRPRSNPEFCFLEKHPPADSDQVLRFSMGQRVGDDCPRGFGFYMDEGNPGFKLPSLIGNTLLLMMVHRDLKEVICSVNEGEIEYQSFVLYDHKKKVASRDYFIVNPLGSLGVLDEDRTDIKVYPKNKFRLRSKPVLARAKLEEIPDIFRLREDVFMIVISSVLVDALRPIKPTNMLLSKLAITE